MLCVLVRVICHDLFRPSHFRKHGRGQSRAAGKLSFFCDLSVMKHPFGRMNVTMQQLIVTASALRGCSDGVLRGDGGAESILAG
jgi:hypothetical protein